MTPDTTEKKVWLTGSGILDVTRSETQYTVTLQNIGLMLRTTPEFRQTYITMSTESLELLRDAINHQIRHNKYKRDHDTQAKEES